MSGETVLVTGGSGFIGSWVPRDLLEAGKRVVALDVRPATERWSRVLGAGAKDVVFSDVLLIDRDALAGLMKLHGVSYQIGYTGTAGYDYVEDVARAFVRGAFECPAGATFADLPSELATTHEIVQRIERCLPAATGRVSVTGPAIPENIPSDFRDIRLVLPGWEPTSLAIGIARTIAYYRSAENNA